MEEAGRGTEHTVYLEPCVFTLVLEELAFSSPGGVQGTHSRCGVSLCL